MALLEHLADLIADRRQGGQPVRVAIDGPDAAGKTTLADELVPPLLARGRTVIRASIDGFHRPRAVRHRRGELSPEGYYHDSFDYPALRHHLLDPLGPAGSRRFRAATFDFRTDEPRTEPLLLAPDRAVLIFDGVFLLRPELNDTWDLRIFLEVPFTETFRRAVERDRSLFGSAEAAGERYRRRYMPGQQLYFAAVRPQQLADVLIDNLDPAVPKLIA